MLNRGLTKKFLSRLSFLDEMSEQYKSCRDGEIIFLNGENFKKAIGIFNPVLTQGSSEQDLGVVYTAAFHSTTKSLIICNNGATLFCHSPRRRIPFIVRHVGLEINMPNHGQEFVNIGIVGDIYSSLFVLRGESACTPSFFIWIATL